MDFLKIKTLFLNEERRHGKRSNVIILHTKKSHRHKKKTDLKLFGYNGDMLADPQFLNDSKNATNSIRTLYSIPNFRNEFIKVKQKCSYSLPHVHQNKTYKNSSQRKKHDNGSYNENPFTTQRKSVRLHVYRCQFTDDGCCCSCNSEAMFEVMKGLYDCYKKKNCDDCNCILCGHIPQEERHLGVVHKSIAAITGPASVKARKEMAKKATEALIGKSPQEKEKLLRELAAKGAPLPEGKTDSEKELIRKIKNEIGLPAEPKTEAEKERLKKAEEAGLILPLEGKSAAQKKKIILQQIKLGVPLPVGRTTSEKAFIEKVKEDAAVASLGKGIPPEKLKRAKAAGLLTPLEGKTPEQREQILRGLAMNGIPLPAGKTASEKKLIEKVRADLGLPPLPKSEKDKGKYTKALKNGIITPLEGKSPSQKELILKRQAGVGISLPEGRTPSERALIKRIAKTPPLTKVPSEQLQKAKAAEKELIKPLEGKTPEQKEKILRGLVANHIPLPEAKTASQKQLIDKIRADLGLPPTPTSASGKEKYNKATAEGLITPLKGKTKAQKEKILKAQFDAKLPLPEGRTSSEKALIKKIQAREKKAKSVVSIISEKIKKAKAKKTKAVKSQPTITPSEKMRKARKAGLITPLEGKTQKQKEKILRSLAENGVPLPEGKTPSEKKLIEKVRHDMGLPPEPTTSSMKLTYAKAQAAGLIIPLEGKTAAQKEKILRAQAQAGLPLPEGRTASEKKLINKIKAEVEAVPAAKSLPAKVPSEKLRKAKEAGLIEPTKDETKAQREKVLRGLALKGVPLPEGKTPSEKKLIEKVRHDMGLPPEPTTSTMKTKYAKAQADGLIIPLEGKKDAQKEKILRAQAQAGLTLPKGRTASEKKLINKIKAEAEAVPAAKEPSEKLRKAKEAGLITPPPKPPIPLSAEARMLDKKTRKVMKEGKGPSDECICGILTPESEKVSMSKLPSARVPDKLKKSKEIDLTKPVKDKTPPQKEAKEPKRAKEGEQIAPSKEETQAQREKVLRDLAQKGVPLPEGKTPSEKKLIDKVRHDMGLPPKPTTPSMKTKYAKAQADGLIIPLEGKKAAEKEKILRAQAQAGIPLPEGRTASEKKLIDKIKAEAEAVPAAKGPPAKEPSEKLRKAKEAGLIEPTKDETKAQREKVLRGLALKGVPLPEGKTPSEKKLIEKVRHDMGLPPEPTTSTMKTKYAKAQADGLIIPLEGKKDAQKEKILRAQAQAGLTLPEGRTASEKKLINKIKAEAEAVPAAKEPSEKLRKAKEAGLITPPPKPPIPLSAEARMLDKKTRKVMKEGKGPSDECICGILTPESEKVSMSKLPSARVPDKLKKSKEIDLTKPVKDKTPPQKEAKEPKRAKEGEQIAPSKEETQAQREKVLRDLAQKGVPLPEGKTPSEKKLIDKVRHDMGLPPKPTTPSMKTKYAKAQADGLIIPLEGKKAAEKEKILRAQAQAGIPLPEGRTASEKKLIDKIKAEAEAVPAAKGPPAKEPSEKLRKAKEAGLIEPTKDETKAQREKVLRGLALKGVPLPEGKTPSEKKLIEKVRHDMGLPPEPTTSTMKTKYAKAQADGLIIPLEGKKDAQKEKILRAQAQAGLTLPEGRTASEKKLINKIKAEAEAVPAAKGPLAKEPSEKLRKAKEAGLITPPPKPPIPLSAEARMLDKKTRKVMKEGKGPSDECICGILTPESEKVSMSKLPSATVPDKLKKSKEIDLTKPVKDKTPPQKEAKEPKRAKEGEQIAPSKEETQAQREKVLRDLAQKGVPLPEGKTPSEKKLIEKVRHDMGLPPVPKTSASKAKYAKAQADGIITPLEGKTHEQKEKVMKALLNAGIPLPEGRTASEKKLIKKLKETKPTAADVTTKKLPELTPSKKVLTTSKKIGIGEIEQKAVKEIGVKSKAGIVEELEEVVKTTTCERACGCDKKKIKFKHSYVKIRITSPDISSLCPCPKDCVPHVKSGVVVDKEGINVTVGSVVGFPSFTSIKDKDNNSKTLLNDASSLSTHTLYVIEEIYSNIGSLKKQTVSEDLGERQDNGNNYFYEFMIDQLKKYEESKDKMSNNDICESESLQSYTYDLNVNRSTESIEASLSISSTESSLSFSASVTSSIDTIEVISVNSNSICTSSHYLAYRETSSTDNIYHELSENTSNDNLLVTKSSERLVLIRNSENKPIIILKHVTNSRELMKIVTEIISQQKIYNKSSVIVVASSSYDEEPEFISKTDSSSICIRLPKNYFNKNQSNTVVKTNFECTMYNT